MSVLEPACSGLAWANCLGYSLAACYAVFVCDTWEFVIRRFSTLHEAGTCFLQLCILHLLPRAYGPWLPWTACLCYCLLDQPSEQECIVACLTLPLSEAARHQKSSLSSFLKWESWLKSSERYTWMQWTRRAVSHIGLVKLHPNPRVIAKSNKNCEITSNLLQIKIQYYRK